MSAKCKLKFIQPGINSQGFYNQWPPVPCHWSVHSAVQSVSQVRWRIGGFLLLHSALSNHCSVAYPLCRDQWLRCCGLWCQMQRWDLKESALLPVDYQVLARCHSGRGEWLSLLSDDACMQTGLLHKVHLKWIILQPVTCNTSRGVSQEIVAGKQVGSSSNHSCLMSAFSAMELL